MFRQTWSADGQCRPAISVVNFVALLKSLMPKYPAAERMTPVNASSAVKCIHCNNAIAVGRWDKMNGFLVECPSCRGYHGGTGSPRALGFMSLFLNAISFFCTMRPSRAFFAMILWIAAIYFIMPRTEYSADWIQVAVWIFFLLGPLIINMALLVRHQIDLDRPPAAVRAA